MKRLLLLAALFCVALFSAGCALVSSASSPPLVMVLCADTSDGSGVSAASMTSLVDSLLPELVGRRGTMVFWALDDVEGAVLVGRFVVGTPLRESRSAVAAFERERLAEGRRTFLLLRDGMFSGHPRTSPLSLALTVMSTNAPKNAEVRYYLASDAREWASGVDMECHPPSLERWTSRLHDTGRLPADSLKGSTVFFVGVRPAMTVPGNRCPANLAMMNQTRALWEAAIGNAGGRVVFAHNQDDLPGLAVIFFTGSGVLWWRKQKVKARAEKNLKSNRYASDAIITELIGPKPCLDPEDPEHETALRRIDHLRVLVEELKGRRRAIGEELAAHIRWGYLAAGAAFAILTEGVAWVIILRDGGVPSPERYLMGLMLGFFFIILVTFAAARAETTGKRGWFIASLVTIGIISIAATCVRVNNALANGASTGEELALGILLLCAALGPAVACEYLLRPLRPVLPLVRLGKEIKKQHRNEKRELDIVTNRLSREARLRRGWETERAMLKACYDGINPPPHQEHGRVNGIATGGTTWTDSGSSSTLRPS